MTSFESDVPWDLIRSFLAVMRTGTLSAAAKRLDATQPTIGRHIDELERRLGAALFLRSSTGLAPTPTAQSLVGHADAMESAARAMKNALSATDHSSGKVRLRCGHIVGAHVMPAMVAALRRRFPQIVVELFLKTIRDDPFLRQTDIAVHFYRPDQGELLIRCVGEVKYGLFAHRSYIARRGAPGELAELARHELIGFNVNDWDLQAFASVGARLSRDDFELRSDSDVAQLQLMNSGAGVGVCVVKVANAQPNLVRILPRQFDYRLGVWLVMHNSLRLGGPARLVYDALADALTEFFKPDGEGGA